MYKLVRIFLLFATLALLSGSAMAQNYSTKVGEKLGTGIANAVTGFVEIPKTMIITGRRHGATYGMTAGLFTGLFHSVGRSLAGALDIATFPVPTTPIVQPSYVWDNFDRETTYKEWKMR
ncbi:MAG: exosortase system-associated protein, TIGR04073 family [Burkholderiales bacterium]|nr:exosortase system-associated protein, TIGR04073 family [Burkholderiales bacterium]